MTTTRFQTGGKYLSLSVADPVLKMKSDPVSAFKYVVGSGLIFDLNIQHRHPLPLHMEERI